MADLGGGHPADVLIAVRLAAQALTVPGMERGGRAAWRMGRGGGGCAAREEPRLETKWPGRRGGDARVCPGHACSSLASHVKGEVRSPPQAPMEVSAWSRQDRCSVIMS